MVDVHLELSPRGGRRAALEQAVRDAIRTGRAAPGARVPSTRELSAKLGLSRGTVSAAYDQLVAEGYLVSRVGSGTVVADLSASRTSTPGGGAEDPSALRYDLRPGSPDVTTFPVAAWLRASRRALATAPSAAFGYGDPAGRIELRVALAEYLGRARGVLASPAQIVVTSGYVQALALLTDVVGTNKAIAMEDPGLPFHRDVVRRAGGHIVPLAVDESGARTDELAAMSVGAVVLTPAHQYPLGMTLLPQRRRAAIEWAAACDGLVIEDDYDGEFRYDRQPVGAMQGIAPDKVAYVGTASKTLGPAVRLAWMVLPERLVQPVVEAKRHTDLHSDALSQLTLADMITAHSYERHIRSSRLRYRRRRDLLVRHLAPLQHVRVDGIAAGLHALVRLGGSGPVEQRVIASAEEQGLALGDLRSHWHVPHPDGPAGLTVGYATPADGAYPVALDILVRVLQLHGPGGGFQPA